MKNKKIPISAAKTISKDYEFPQVVIFAYDPETGKQHVTTYGKSLRDCDSAAKAGNSLKKFLGWPDELCEEEPARIKRYKKKNIRFEEGIYE